MSEGLLGRKYLVNGAWVDYGTKQVATLPSKIVRFYLARGGGSVKHVCVFI